MSAPLPHHSSHHRLVREGMGAGPRAVARVGSFWLLLSIAASVTQSGCPLSRPLPPRFLLQRGPRPGEVPDLLAVRKSGVSRTHSLPNDSYMCRDRSTAEGSPGHRSWGLPKAQSGTRARG